MTLSDDQIVELQEDLDALDINSFSQIDMLRQYIVAKSYIYVTWNMKRGLIRLLFIFNYDQKYNKK